MRPSPLRIALRIAPAALAIVGVAAGAALTWFSYRYVYRTITTTDVPAPERLAPALERIDPERVKSLDMFLRATMALPALDPAAIRDVFRAPNAAPATSVDPRRKL